MSLMNHYEGSIAPMDSDEYTEPVDVMAPTASLACYKVMCEALTSGEAEQNVVYKVCVREIAVTGEPLSDWEYSTGNGWMSPRAIIKPLERS